MDFNIKSDCAPFNQLIKKLIKNVPNIHLLRDSTRDGLATTLNEIAMQFNVSIGLIEDEIPIKQGGK